jgi:hypothetical protein
MCDNQLNNLLYSANDQAGSERVVPTPVLRFALAITVTATVLVVGGLGTGTAIAEPDDSSNSSEPGSSTEPGNVDPPAVPATPTPSATPKSLPEQLRDLLKGPLSIFGNGRQPGDPPVVPGVTSGTRKSDVTETVQGTLPRKVDVPDVPVAKAPEPVATRVTSGSTAEVRLPFTPAFTVPVPTPPGRADMKWSIDLTDPTSTYATIQQTVATFNSLIADTYAPPPAPAPTPGPQPRVAARTFQESPAESPVLDVDGTAGGDAATPVSAGSGGGGLPVLQAPPVVVPRVAAVNTPPTIRGVSPVPDVLAGGTAGAPTPAVRGSVASTGTTTPLDPIPVATGSAVNPITTPMGTTVRQGYAQSLRVARVGEIAVVAVPGVAGLLALTFGGGVIGYRQANSGRYLRQDAVRFVR